jgi:two-component system cell cycle response regulator
VYIHKYFSDGKIAQNESKIIIASMKDMYYKKRLDGTIDFKLSSYKIYQEMLEADIEGFRTVVKPEIIADLTGEEYRALMIMYLNIEGDRYFISIGFENSEIDYSGSVDIEKKRLYSIFKKKLETDKKMRELKNKNKAYYKMAFTDSLTGIYNRTMLDKYSKELFKEGEKVVGVITFDIDKFKSVNDTYGHDMGDEVIKKFASSISYAIKEKDYAIRNGGDEFLVIIEEDELDRCKKAAYSIAERIREQMEKHVFKVPKSEIEVKVTISGGIYCEKNNKAHSFKSFLKKADEILYLSKGEGRNRISIYEE